MRKTLKQILDDEFKDVMNSDRAERSFETAIRVLNVLKSFVKKYPTEKRIVEDAIDLVEVYEEEVREKPVVFKPSKCSPYKPLVDSSGGRKHKT